jgi:hypothetical protein
MKRGGREEEAEEIKIEANGEGIGENFHRDNSEKGDRTSRQKNEQ